MAADHLSSNASVIEVAAEQRLGILIVSKVRFFAEALADILGRDQAVSISVASQFSSLAEMQPDVVLLDAAFPNGTAEVRHIGNVASGVRVVVLAITETEENIILWAEAGAAGYIPATAGMADLNALIADVMRGEQRCPGRVVGGLLRWIAKGGRAAGASQGAPFAANLTIREMQIIQLVGDGLSNKDIARRLNIGVGTTKSHVHNLLRKLGLQRRNQVPRWVDTGGLQVASR
jgi:two-component system, NarL family, nitrate/nitrite response regulator NarL